MREPLIHLVNDELPDDHYLKNDSEYCNKCRAMVHACNNEQMRPWVESGAGNLCFECFFMVVESGAIEDEAFALSDK